MAVLIPNNNLKIHNHLTRSLERILEEANHCGELKLSNRKLKDFPKAKEKYNLSDTVIADLSKNRFNELPDDVTGFHYLEHLNCYHNAIRFIPDSIISLQCLSYLDLSRNQLTTLPRELCQLPIQILLVSNNCLSSLPDDLYKMSHLTELDASCNKIAHFPPRMGELKSLMALELRNNLLLAIPIEITFLRLARLDLRANRISTLPVEIRDMDTLIDLFVDDNPLTNPPAKLCKRGRIHIFKYLDTEAMKIMANRSGICASGTLGRRSKKTSANSPSPGPTYLINSLKQKRQNVDSGYSTSSDGCEKRWSQEMQGDEKRWPPSTPILERNLDQPGTRSATSTPSTISSVLLDGSDEDNTRDDDRQNEQHRNLINNARLNSSSSDNVAISNGIEDKLKPLHQIQTYKEYKEALKQQRAHDVPSIYRTRDLDDQGSYKTEPNTPPTHQPIISGQSMITSKSDPTPLNSAFSNTKKNILDDVNGLPSKKPIQMVPPSRNTSFSSTNNHAYTNGNAADDVKPRLIHDYIKPNSPVKPSLSHNIPPRHNDLSLSPAGKSYLNLRAPSKVPLSEEGCVNGNNILLLKTMVQNNQGTKSSQRNVISWNLESNRSSEKMSFTMRREIDKAREESDLINQLRNIIETRLKMIIPEEDLASALTDGVVLCHLANHIKPRSVASIHVPSPAVPKLTMARCRRNVDNFIDACRKIGVDEDKLCNVLDITEGLHDRSGLLRLFDTVEELCKFEELHRNEKEYYKWTSQPNTLNNKTQPKIIVDQAMKIRESPIKNAAVSFLLLSVFVSTVVLLFLFPPS